MLRPLLLLLLLAMAGPGHAIELRMLAAWDDRYPGRAEIAERYARKVYEAAGGALTFVLSGPDEVPPFMQLEPVVLGIFDLLLTHGAYHVDTTAVGLALDAMVGDPAALRAAGVWDAIDRHYQALGLKLIALPVSSAGRQLILRNRVGPACSLEGRTIRASPVYHGLVEALGAKAAGLPIADVHAALAQRTLDGVAWSTVGTLPYRWHEVARHLLRPTFGSYTHLLLMNLATWQQLPQDLQRLLLEQGAALEQKVYTRFSKIATSEENELKLRGTQLTMLCGAALERLPQAWADGVWRYAIDTSGEDARALRELAERAGLTPGGQ